MGKTIKEITFVHHRKKWIPFTLFYLLIPPFPGNTTSEYTVKLPNVIDLSDGNWAVALSSIVFPLTFTGVEEEEKITIYYNDGTSHDTIIPRRIQYNTIKEFEKALNHIIMTSRFESTLLSAITAAADAETADGGKRQKREAPDEAQKKKEIEAMEKSIKNITSAFNTIKTLKEEIGNKLKKIDDVSSKDAKTKIVAASDEFDQLFENAKSEEWLAKSGQSNVNLAHSKNDLEHSKRFVQKIAEMESKFLDAGGFQKKSSENSGQNSGRIRRRKKTRSKTSHQRAEPSCC